MCIRFRLSIHVNYNFRCVSRGGGGGKGPSSLLRDLKAKKVLLKILWPRILIFSIKNIIFNDFRSFNILPTPLSWKFLAATLNSNNHNCISCEILKLWYCEIVKLWSRWMVKLWMYFTWCPSAPPSWPSWSTLLKYKVTKSARSPSLPSNQFKTVSILPP